MRMEPALRLFCFHHAGGNSGVFKDWKDALPSEVDVMPLDLPGRGRYQRDLPRRRMAELIEELGCRVSRSLDIPVALFGHSMGALVAFEVAHFIRATQYAKLVHLFVAGCPAPQCSPIRCPSSNTSNEELVDELRRMRGTPKAVLDSPELMEIILPTLRADFEVVETYICRTRARLDCPIRVYGGIDDSERPADSLSGWEEQSSISCSIQMFPGDHFFPISYRPQLLKVLSNDLRNVLTRLDPHPSGISSR